MTEPSLDLHVAEIPPWGGESGDFERQGDVHGPLTLSRPRHPDLPLRAGLLVAHGMLELGVIGGMAFGAMPLPLGIAALVCLMPLALPLLNGLRGTLPVSLQVDADRVRGAVRQRMETAGLLWTLNGGDLQVPVDRVAAVLLTVRRVRPGTGTGRYSQAELALALDPAGQRQLAGPRSPELGEGVWAEARGALLPLGVALARRLRCPLRVIYEGWPGEREPVVRELRI